MHRENKVRLNKLCSKGIALVYNMFQSHGNAAPTHMGTQAQLKLALCDPPSSNNSQQSKQVTNAASKTYAFSKTKGLPFFFWKGGNFPVLLRNCNIPAPTLRPRSNIPIPPPKKNPIPG